MRWKYLKYLIPNLLSFVRMLAVIPLWFAFADASYGYTLAIKGFVIAENINVLALSLYIVALITDWLDGASARWLNAVSDIGKLLDPLADKVLHLFVLYQFLQVYPRLSVPFVLIVIFAVVLAALPGIVIYFQVERRLGANWFGKTKLCTEGAAIILLFGRYPSVAFWLLWLAIFLAIGSIIGHLVLKEDKDYRWWLRWLLRIKERQNV